MDEDEDIVIGEVGDGNMSENEFRAKYDGGEDISDDESEVLERSSSSCNSSALRIPPTVPQSRTKATFTFPSSPAIQSDATTKSDQILIPHSATTAREVHANTSQSVVQTQRAKPQRVRCRQTFRR